MFQKHTRLSKVENLKAMHALTSLHRNWRNWTSIQTSTTIWFLCWPSLSVRVSTINHFILSVFVLDQTEQYVAQDTAIVYFLCGEYITLMPLFPHRWAHQVPEWSYSQEQHPCPLWEVPTRGDWVHQVRMPDGHRGPVPADPRHHWYPHHHHLGQGGLGELGRPLAKPLSVLGFWGL